jgi:hypothetical protein
VLYVVTSGLPVTRTRRVRNIGRIDMALHGLVNEPASGRVVSEMLSAARPSAPQRWWKSSLGTSHCTLVHTGVRSIHGSQMRERCVRPCACRGAGLGDGAHAPAESPWRFHQFFHAVRACVSRVQGHERIESGFDDRLGLRYRKRRSASRSRERTPHPSGLVVDSAPGARDLPSLVASAPACQLLIRHRKGSRSRHVRGRHSPPVLCIWS